MERAKVIKTPFIYSGQTTVSANSTAQLVFQVPSDYSYAMTAWTYKTTKNASATYGVFDVQFYDNQRQIMSDYAPCEVFNGFIDGMITAGGRHGNYQFNQFAKPLVIAPKSDLVVFIRDTSGYELTVRIVIDGYRIRRA